jgi:signal transduction histidine kinase
MKEKNVSVDKLFPDDELPCEADSDKIKQVILNLLKNAIEASCRNDVISIFINKDGDNVTLGVNDVGAGVPENIIDNIFDVFYTTKRHGTGLGLAISKNIIVAHGGSLLARNRPEGGSTFAFTIPLSA